MAETITLVTISHLLGSGGAYIGAKLAERLGIPFLDREILQKVSRELNMLETEVEDREERLSSYWENFTRSLVWVDPVISMELPRATPSDRDLYDVECNTILQIAEKKSAVFLGRCGWHVLKDYPNHVSILLYANLSDRLNRVQSLYHLDPDAAQKMIQSNDRERTDYNRIFTQKNWLDARNYDLCINTSSVGWDGAIEIAETTVHNKLSHVANESSPTPQGA